MRNFDQDPSPVSILPPPQAFNMGSNHNLFLNHSPYDQPSPASTFFSRPHTPQISSGAGRKRSRDQAAPNLEDDDDLSSIGGTESALELEEGWVYGEGMTLIRPNGFVIDASSQTGTWAEEKVVSLEFSKLVAQIPPCVQDRPFRSNKLQRLDLTATPGIMQEASPGNGLAIPSTPPRMASSSREDPTVDDFTMNLGIGWSRINDDKDIQAAARGWARYIETHYPVSEAQIRLQSRGLASYLVETREGWYLFCEDLKEGRLVSTSLEKTFENLRTSPPIFDGVDVLVATSEALKLDVQMKQELIMKDMEPTREVVTNVTPGYGPAGQSLEVEMDMS